MLPNKSYLICATPRSGSTLLCQLLSGTGLAGRPAEYFEFLEHSGCPSQPIDYFLERREDLSESDWLEIVQILDGIQNTDEGSKLEAWRKGGYCHYLSEVLTGTTTPNGIFGAKMMWGYFANFLRLTQSGTINAIIDGHDIVRNAFPNIRYIELRRSDKLRQAISFWKAIQTQQWRRDHSSATKQLLDSSAWCEPVFHAGAIRYLYHFLERHERSWREFFQHNGAPVLTVTYEALVANFDRCVLKILDFLEISFRGGFHRQEFPTLVQQRDLVTEDWVARLLDKN